MTVTAHLVVQFTGNDSSSGNRSGISIEVDKRPDGLNEGKTQFSPGSVVRLLVWLNGTAEIDEVLTSAGTIVPEGEVFVTLEEKIQFAAEDEATLARQYVDTLTTEWVGNSLGPLAVDGTQIKAPIKGVGIANITYRAKAKVYALYSPPTVGGKTSYDILVVVKGHDAT